MKVAIVHDWFVGGGAERVVYELHKMYPKAPIYTAYCSPEWRERLSNTDVITSYMQRWPFSKLRKLLPPLRALWFSGLDLSGYDLVISSSGAEAKAVRTEPKQKWTVRVMHLVGAQGANENREGAVRHGTATAARSSQHSDPAESSGGVGGSAGKQARTVHISYCHAPTHYYWSRYESYLEHPGFGFFDPLARLALKLLVGPMRRWDYKAAQRPDYLIANSSYTKDQIQKYYDRESAVIHPPVDIDRFKILNKSGNLRQGFVTAGRQTPYKRIDLPVLACTQLGLPLVVIGNGPEHKKLKSMAGKSITFLRGKSDEEVAHYFQSALAFIFPGTDDFGIVAVEALAAGTPVIAYKAGGALDYIEPGVTGLFFEEQTAESLSAALKKFSPEKFDSASVQRKAKDFSVAVFRSKMKQFISSKLS